VTRMRPLALLAVSVSMLSYGCHYWEYRYTELTCHTSPFGGHSIEAVWSAIAPSGTDDWDAMWSARAYAVGVPEDRQSLVSDCQDARTFQEVALALDHLGSSSPEGRVARTSVSWDGGFRMMFIRYVGVGGTLIPGFGSRAGPGRPPTGILFRLHGVESGRSEVRKMAIVVDDRRSSVGHILEYGVGQADSWRRVGKVTLVNESRTGTRWDCAFDEP
jgi:hypothetical protein